jgi:hypothetical protein
MGVISKEREHLAKRTIAATAAGADTLAQKRIFFYY